MSGVAEVSSTYLAKMASNTIPFGYKQTEVGVIPKDWVIEKLGSIGKFKNGINKSADDFGFGHPFVNLMDVFGKPEIRGNESFGLINSTEIDKKEYSLVEGDVLFIRSSVKPSGVGLTTVVMSDLKETVYSGFLIRFRTDKQLVTEFKKHCFYEESFRVRVISNSTVSANTNINQDALKDIYFVFPSSKKEQTAIANALSDVDALIGEQEKLIAKKQAIKTATMQQLLTGRTRLPQFALREDGTPKGTKQSELGEVPEDWEIVCFDQLKDKKDNWAITGGPFGSNLKASDYTENGVRVIQLQNIGDGVFKNDDFVYTSYKKANELISCNIYPDEIILSKMGDPVARACLIPHFHSRYVMCSDGIRLKVDSQRYSEKFVFYFLNYPLFRNQALDASTGSTRKRIGLSELRDLLLFAPPKEEQTAIATILSDMDEEIQALEQRLGKTRQIKQGMMQELLTGKTRLPIT
ncbi:restriction endonuclease subunit S [Escherichia coli]|uniref:restriction endonuclease subunit S n=1 Tax=Escherichia coli TaxID=562 RepID=UPI0023797EBD|nr:restriction endonuclease subunit S [Escherichia coli]